MPGRATAGRCASWCSRRSGEPRERPESGRAVVLGLAADEPELLDLFGEPRGPEPASAGEDRCARRRRFPQWLMPELSPLVAEAEWPALLERAPLDLRVNAARAARDDLLIGEFEGGEADAAQPVGHPAYAR